MSPISADAVPFLVPAARLAPALAPRSPLGGSLAARREPPGSADAVLPTSLCGLPERVTEYSGKTLVEDVAHDIQPTVDGRPLATFGVAAAFGLSNPVAAGSGGVLAV